MVPLLSHLGVSVKVPEHVQFHVKPLKLARIDKKKYPKAEVQEFDTLKLISCNNEFVS